MLTVRGALERPGADLVGGGGAGDGERDEGLSSVSGEPGDEPTPPKYVSVTCASTSLSLSSSDSEVTLRIRFLFFLDTNADSAAPGVVNDAK